jgi:hypothetical protein
MGRMAPQGPHQLSQGPQENAEKLGSCSNFLVGRRNFTACIIRFKFKIESDVSFSSKSPAEHKAKVVFYSNK